MIEIGLYGIDGTVAVKNGCKIIDDSSLIMYYDAAKILSYPKFGNSITNLKNENKKASITGAANYTYENKGMISLSSQFVDWNNPIFGSEFTVCTLIKPSPIITSPAIFTYNSLGTATTVLYIKITKVSATYYMQVLLSGYPLGYSEELNIYNFSDVTNYVNNNRMIHFAVTFKRTNGVGSVLKTYLNGIFSEQIINTNSFWSNTATCANSNYIISSAYTGALSQCLAYNRELKNEEISMNYNAIKDRL